MLAVRYRTADHRTASDVSYKMRYRGAFSLGYLLRDDKLSGFDFDREVNLGGTLAVEFLPTGRWHSLQQWNNASVGLALTVLDMGQQKYVGQAIAPHAYLNIPLVHHPKAVFGLRPGIGLGFVTRTYANTVPDELRWKSYRIMTENGYVQVANASIGSIVNAFLTGGFYFDFPIKNGWDVTLSVAWQHLSNGSVMTPNGGLNMFNAELGMAYTPSRKTMGFHYYEPDTDVPSRLHDGVKKKWGIEMYAGGGVRNVYYCDRDWFGVASAGLSVYWQPVSIFRVGIGGDMYYDGAYAALCDEFASEGAKHVTYYGKTYLRESKTANCFRVGVSLQPEFVVGNFTFGYHVGVYLYDPVKNLEPYSAVVANNGKPLNRGIFYAYDPTKVSNYQDGWCYQKLMLRYYCGKNFFVHLGLKLHVIKAEFIDAGIGVRI